MLRYTLVRLGQAILVLLVVATVVFLLSRASGNYAELMAPPDAPPETVQQIEKNLGLDKPLINQYVDYMKDLLHGDLGQSFAYRQPVRDLIATALPNTIELGVCAFAFAAVFGIAIGVLLGDEAGRLDRPRRQGPGPRRSVGPVVLARHPAGPLLLGTARLVPAVRAGRLGASRAAGDRPWCVLSGVARAPHPLRRSSR